MKAGLSSGTLFGLLVMSSNKFFRTKSGRGHFDDVIIWGAIFAFYFLPSWLDGRTRAVKCLAQSREGWAGLHANSRIQARSSRAARSARSRMITYDTKGEDRMVRW